MFSVLTPQATGVKGLRPLGSTAHEEMSFILHGKAGVCVSSRHTEFSRKATTE